MKMFLPVFLLVGVGAFSAIDAQSLVDGVRVGSVARPGARSATPYIGEQLCSKIGGECKADCKTFMICSEIGARPDATRQCSEDRPYCNSNACSATPDPTNQFCLGTVDVTFSCTGTGLFPDPLNCSQYFNCPSANDNAFLFECPAGAVYDSRVQSCVSTNLKQLMKPRSTRAAKPCTVTECPRRFVGYVAYKSNPAYYLYCNENTLLVFRCPDPENQVYDTKLDSCTFQCRAPGNFKDRLDCHKFYTCTKKGAYYQMGHNSCPPLYWFNTANGVCELEENGVCEPEITV